ncbi:MAG: hypothetical protein ACI9UO_001247 [Nitrospinales bacterium]|jgi:hypothetical protein
MSKDKTSSSGNLKFSIKDLSKVDMHGQDLRFADLSFATNLLAIDVESAYIDKETKFSTYIEIKWKSEREYSSKDILPREKYDKAKKVKGVKKK